MLQALSLGHFLSLYAIYLLLATCLLIGFYGLWTLGIYGLLCRVFGIWESRVFGIKGSRDLETTL